MSSKDLLIPLSEELPEAHPQCNGVAEPSSTIITAASTPRPVYVMPSNTIPPLGPKSCRITCPSCRHTGMTKTEYASNSRTHFMAFILLFTCCCCCLPYNMNSCRTAQHTCPYCGEYLGTFDN